MDPAEILREITERTTVRAFIAGGQRDPNQLTDTVFATRHPERGGRRLEPSEHALVGEWRDIRGFVVEPELMCGSLAAESLAGPARGGAPPDAVISAVAHCARPLRPRTTNANAPCWMVVHCTGSGPAERSKHSVFTRPALEYALDVYLSSSPKATWPHYVIDFNGAIHAVSDERDRGRHAGWSKLGGAAFWTSGEWSAPAWWSAVWSPARTPVDLLPAGAHSPNSSSIGVELLIHEQHYTHDQYIGLARLIAELVTRYPAMRPVSAPQSGVLLGHEDVDPRTGETGRANEGGGWDPGAHRTAPYFSWERLWNVLEPMLA
jgi:hypothetical protein